VTDKQTDRQMYCCIERHTDDLERKGLKRSHRIDKNNDRVSKWGEEEKKEIDRHRESGRQKQTDRKERNRPEKQFPYLHSELGTDRDKKVSSIIYITQFCKKIQPNLPECKGWLPFAKMSAQIAAIYVCICILCAESGPNFQLENFLNCMHMHAYMQQKSNIENYFSHN
jgi:hypothetical protein